MKIYGKPVSKGTALGRTLISSEPLSFLGGVDPKTGVVVEKNHPLEGKKITGRVLVFPNGKGSTVGAYVIYQLRKEDKAPAAIINLKADAMVASGAIIAGIPMLHRLEKNPLELKDDATVRVNADEGYIEVDD
jgi:predicted aconitase with swiveling domain